MSGLDPNFQSHTDADRFGWCELVRIDFPSLLLAMTSHEREVSFDGVDYQPDGALGSIEGMRTVDELRPTRTTISLSGLDERVLNQLSNEYTLWSRIRVWGCVLDLESYAVEGVEMLGDYFAGQPTIRLGEGSGEVEISAESMSTQLGRDAMLAASPSIQQQRFSGDRIFDDVAKIPGREIRWSRNITRLGGGSPIPPNDAWSRYRNQSQ